MLRLVDETDHDLVVLKPAGMASELSQDREGTSLLARLQAGRDERLHLVHRLDRVTRGFLVVAKGREAAAKHGAALASRWWDKRYLARVRGDVPTGLHRRFLKERSHRVEVVRAGGQPAWLEVQATAREGRDTWVAVRLLTGRRHQVRVMLADLGAPLVGDPLYGGIPGPFYLEHAALRLPDPWSQVVRAWFDPTDAERPFHGLDDVLGASLAR